MREIILLKKHIGNRGRQSHKLWCHLGSGLRSDVRYRADKLQLLYGSVSSFWRNRGRQKKQLVQQNTYSSLSYSFIRNTNEKNPTSKHLYTHTSWKVRFRYMPCILIRTRFAGSLLEIVFSFTQRSLITTWKGIIFQSPGRTRKIIRKCWKFVFKVSVQGQV